jgi:hypothetical protein
VESLCFGTSCPKFPFFKKIHWKNPHSAEHSCTPTTQRVNGSHPESMHRCLFSSALRAPLRRWPVSCFSSSSASSAASFTSLPPVGAGLRCRRASFPPARFPPLSLHLTSCASLSTHSSSEEDQQLPDVTPTTFPGRNPTLGRFMVALRTARTSRSFSWHTHPHSALECEPFTNGHSLLNS